jgi:PAS domain S-box-containing protein
MQIRMTPTLVTFGTTALLLLFALLDYLTGYEFSFSLFYLMPLVLTTWYGYPRMAYVLAILASILSVLTNLLAGRHYDHVAVLYWNMLVLVGFFTIIVFLLDRVHIRTVLLHSLLHNLQVGVLLLGPKGDILVSNPAAATLLGVTEKQLLGKIPFDPAWNVVHEDGSPFAQDDFPIARAAATGMSVRNISMGVYRPATHDRLWLLVNADPLYGADGAIRQVVCSFSDVRAQKQLQWEHEHLIAELQEALTDIKTLEGLLPICAGCKQIRDDRGVWQKLETYIRMHTEASVTHGICPECTQRLYPDLL